MWIVCEPSKFSGPPAGPRGSPARAGPAKTGEHRGMHTRGPSTQRLIQQVLLQAPTGLCTQGLSHLESAKLTKCCSTCHHGYPAQRKCGGSRVLLYPRVGLLLLERVWREQNAAVPARTTAPSRESAKIVGALLQTPLGLLYPKKVWS